MKTTKSLTAAWALLVAGLLVFDLKAQRMPEIVALINSSIDSGQDFQCDDSGWVTYKKVNFTGSDYQSLLYFEFDLGDVKLIYAHKQFVFLENHEKYWVHLSHHYTDHKLDKRQNNREGDILTSAAITLDLKPGVDPEPIIKALKLLKGDEIE